MADKSLFNQFFDINEELDSFGKGFSNFNNVKPQNNTQKINNSEYHDDYADFTEIEDENGKIMLIKYSKKYEFRGNDYCIYTLCDEKTGSCEEGIAQIKGGQYVRLTDPERIEKIRACIIDKQNNMIEAAKNQTIAESLTYVSHKIYCGDVYILYRDWKTYHIFDAAQQKFWHDNESQFKKLAKKLFNI